jgi:hypothetical protein
MKQRPFTLEGFRAMFRRPSFGLAEIAWRWSFGSAAVLLLTFSFLEYLDTLPVSAGDMFFLRTRQPFLISQALLHILRGSGARLADAAIVLGLALALAWIGIAALGRAVTIKALLGYLSEELNNQELAGAKAWRFQSLVGLNFFRVAAILAAAVGWVAAWILAGAVSPDSDPSPGSAMLVFLTMILLVGLAWSAVNWFLSFATVFAVAEGEDTFGAIASAADFCRTRTGPIVAVSSWFGLAHLVAFFLATSVVGFPLAFAPVLPAGVVLGGVLLVTLLYFALADYLYVGRLAGYLAIIANPQMPTMPEITPPSPDNGSLVGVSPETRVDPDELILSDLPPLPVS